MLLQVFARQENGIKTEERVLVEPACAWLASILFDEPSACEIQRDSREEDIRDSCAYCNEEDWRLGHVSCIAEDGLFEISGSLLDEV